MVPTDTEYLSTQEYFSDEQKDEHHCTIDSSLIAFQTDVPGFGSRGDDQVQYPRSRISGKTRVASGGHNQAAGQVRRKKKVYPCA